MNNNLKWKKPSRVALLLYMIGSLGALIYACTQQKFYLILLAVAALILPLIPALFYRLARQKPVYLFNLVFYAFSFVALPFASVLGGYNLVPYLDKLLHCLSGFLFAIVGMLLYYALKPKRCIEVSDARMAPLFSLMFACFTALLWEIFEFTASLFGADPQLVAATGVTDTMLDMIVCALGGLITAFFSHRYLKTGKKELTMALFEDYYYENLQKPDDQQQAAA